MRFVRCILLMVPLGMFSDGAGGADAICLSLYAAARVPVAHMEWQRAVLGDPFSDAVTIFPSTSRRKLEQQQPAAYASVPVCVLRRASSRASIQSAVLSLLAGYCRVDALGRDDEVVPAVIDKNVLRFYQNGSKLPPDAILPTPGRGAFNLADNDEITLTRNATGDLVLIAMDFSYYRVVAHAQLLETIRQGQTQAAMAQADLLGKAIQKQDRHAMRLMRVAIGIVLAAAMAVGLTVLRRRRLRNSQA